MVSRQQFCHNYKHVEKTKWIKICASDNAFLLHWPEEVDVVINYKATHPAHFLLRQKIVQAAKQSWKGEKNLQSCKKRWSRQNNETTLNRAPKRLEEIESDYRNEAPGILKSISWRQRHKQMNHQISVSSLWLKKKKRTHQIKFLGRIISL